MRVVEGEAPRAIPLHVAIGAQGDGVVLLLAGVVGLAVVFRSAREILVFVFLLLLLVVVVLFAAAKQFFERAVVERVGE